MIEIRHPGMQDTAATQQAYNQIYESKGIQLRDSVYLWLIGLLKARKGSLLLDISTGKGRLVELARLQGLNAMGVDFSFAGIDYAHKNYPRAGWLVGDGEELPLPARAFDCITHIGSLEHYQNPVAGIQEIARLLKPDGMACVFLPNTFSLLGNIQYAWKYGDAFDDGQPLQRYNTAIGWRNLLHQNGLLVKKMYGFEIDRPRTWQDLRWILLHPSKLAHLFVSILIPVNLANSIVYICGPTLD